MPSNQLWFSFIKGVSLFHQERIIKLSVSMQ
uniref:Uncharacterized protein n=1 Tax=Anguilla anguilla TaxID=7936 RepID=A0A0E9SMQ9_ANGAN